MNGKILDSTDSTQLEMRRVLSEGPVSNFYWIQATNQQMGRGRQEREWISLCGNLHLSIWVMDHHPLQTWLPHRIGLALYEALIGELRFQGFSNLENRLRLKWPNDLVVIDPSFPDAKSKKLAGILIEKFQEGYIVGIGLNCYTAPNLTPTKGSDQGAYFQATSLTEIGVNSSIESLRDKILKQIIFEFSDPEKIRSFQDRYRAKQCFQNKQKIVWSNRFGTFEGIGEHGEMIVIDEAGVKQNLFSEDVFGLPY